MSEMNGSEALMMGSLMGQILASNSEQIRLAHANIVVLERIQDNIQELPNRLAQTIGAQARPSQRQSIMRNLDISFRELILIGGAVLAGLAGLAEGQNLKQALKDTAVQITGQ